MKSAAPVRFPYLIAEALRSAVRQSACQELWSSCFNWSMELTNSEAFCISCHEMDANVYLEYKKTIHYSNRTGVRATCLDCHVPKTWIHKIARKVQATNELYHHFVGSIDTREEFEAKRLKLATSVWKVMKDTDSRECRNCHNFEYMDFTVHEKCSRDRRATPPPSLIFPAALSEPSIAVTVCAHSFSLGVSNSSTKSSMDAMTSS